MVCESLPVRARNRRPGPLIGMKNKIINFVAFQVGWFACVLGAANDMPVLGLIAAAGVIALHLVLVVRPLQELWLIFFAVSIGLVFDSVLVTCGWLRYPNGMLAPGLAPYWILAMWAMFATTLNMSMDWMRGRAFLAVLMGAVFGPLSYQAGARLGGLEFVQPVFALIALSFGWAIIMPLLLELSKRFDGVAEPRNDASFEPAAQGEGS